MIFMYSNQATPKHALILQTELIKKVCKRSSDWKTSSRLPHGMFLWSKTTKTL
jgi:hypothetical protein